MQLPDWFMNYGNGRDANGNIGVPTTSVSQFGQLDQMRPPPQLGPNPVPPPSTGPGTSGFQMPPMPTPRPPDSALSAYHAATAPTSGLGAPMQLSGATASTPPPYQPTQNVGTGSWFDPSKLGDLVDKNSVIGKLLAMRNPSAAPTPGQPREQEGLLPHLYHGLFGSGGQGGVFNMGALSGGLGGIFGGNGGDVTGSIGGGNSAMTGAAPDINSIY